MSRTGLQPFVQERPRSSAPPMRTTAEFGALLRIMQEANLDLLGKFYGGAELYYESSVAQKILRDIGTRAAGKADAKLRQTEHAPAFLKKFTRMLAERVLKAEEAYVIDNVAGYAIEAAASQAQGAIVSAATRSIPIIGLLKTGYDAMVKDVEAVDLIIRAACAKRHATKLKAGPPRAAAEAVHKIVSIKATLTSVSGATSTGAFASGVAAEVGSFGAATGTAEVVTAIVQAVVDLVVWLVEMIIDIMDYERGRRLLADLPGIVNPDQEKFIKLFNDCPILGCYMLATPIFPTSAFVWLVTTDRHISSVDEVERVAIRHVAPLRLEASALIRDATFKMRNPENPAADENIRQAMAGESPEAIAIEIARIHKVRAAAADAEKRSESLDKNVLERALDRATAGAGVPMPGFGPDGTHTFTRHEGKLHGLSEKIKKYKKSAKTAFITETRVGRYLESTGAIKK
jgi:hypothetical protein